MKKFCEGIIIQKNKINDDLFELIIKVGEIVNQCVAGQFVSIYIDDKSKILPRPISISEINKENETISLVIQKVGNGTKILSNIEEDSKVSILLPLGNGYDFQDIKGTVYLIGGGVGIPPLVGAYSELKKLGFNKIKVILGFRNEPFLTNKFSNNDFEICSDTGNFGFKGNVVEKLLSMEKPDYIISCGPKLMLKGVVEYSIKNNINSQISMEERMACSVGVCLGCVINIKDGDKIVSKKVCVDGPVFRGEELIFE
ncbi:MAG: dihydroorotate dehydrogenase electron transfer subunit [Lachnospirales bacterium]